MDMLIIPDVHGRDFWKEPVKKVLEDTSVHIVFLGDYTDGYPQEWTYNFNYKQHTVDNFKEIIDLKRQNPDRITLLLGNHDCGYAIGEDICSSRMDQRHKKELENIFKENSNLFQLVERREVGRKTFIFSHAGILKGWASQIWGDDIDNIDVVEELNKAWWQSNFGILNMLGDYDNYRGFGGYKYGSPIWSDIRSWVKITPEDTFGYNIVGHTKCVKPVVLDTITDLDCRKAFYLGKDGSIYDYQSGEKLKKSM